MATEAFTPEGVKLIGGRRFWVCREKLSDSEIKKAFDELEERSDQGGDGPLGISADQAI